MKKAVFLSLTLFGACAVQGAEPVADGFETYTIGSAIPNGSNGWTNLFVTATQGGKVVATNSAFGTGSKVLQFKDTDSNNSGNPSVQNKRTQSVTEDVISFDFCLNSYLQNPIFHLKSGAINGISLTLCSTGKYLQYHNGAAFVDLINMTNNLGKWYRVELTVADVTTASDTFNMRILQADGGSGTEIGSWTNLSFRTGVASLDRVEFGMNSTATSTGGDYYLDNIQVGRQARLALVLIH
ncbi:MAG: hypothetical protein HOO88_08525 [Kiritimatiellaceae bacterium]|nr:hypothetical protein [Kiritimatiellaceae bacterium]